MSEDYRREQELFVSHLTGGSVWEVLLVLAHVPLLVSIVRMLHLRIPSFLTECAIVVVPSVLILTTCAEVTHFTLMSFGALLALLWGRQARVFTDETSTSDDGGYIALFKGSNVLLTCICILAVDYRVFPRAFAKTERFGLSLMDLGTGSFIVSSAITSRVARHERPTTLFSWRRLAVLALAVSRTASIKVLGYQEHVSEYGVHWNFFATLFCVWAAVDALHSVMPPWAVAAAGSGTLVLYQWALLSRGWSEYLLGDLRADLVDENKEGLFSLFGYIPLFLLAEVGASKLLHPASTGATRRGLWLWGSAAALWAAWSATDAFVQGTSRRLCNAPYVLLVLAVCTTMLTLLLAAQSTGRGEVTTLSSFSKGSLPVFLVANVSTGVVNMATQTLRAGPAQAVTVLLLYALGLTAVAWLWSGRRPWQMD